jgi:hypothetical protein
MHFPTSKLLGHTVVMVAVAGGAQALDEFLVVGDDDELEVGLGLAVLDNVVESRGEGLSR